MKAKPRMLAPSECNTEASSLNLNRRHIHTPRSWIASDGVRVSIHNQRNGKPSTAEVHLSVADMRKFARWFLRKQRCTK